MLIICHTHSKDTRANTMVIGYLVTKNGTSGRIHDFFTVMRLFFDLPLVRFCTGCAEGETYVF